MVQDLLELVLVEALLLVLVDLAHRDWESQNRVTHQDQSEV